MPVVLKGRRKTAENTKLEKHDEQRAFPSHCLVLRYQKSWREAHRSIFQFSVSPRHERHSGFPFNEVLSKQLESFVLERR